ncbi:RluA family pseudouridine synthase [Enterovirga rhinocerotis]|uniref:Pseudouridine synthase n=1 Tax=Enterovirga rhinocerotis TaxID=1339210 RepID=A0A4R7C9S1_9HYPH|nr:RluA family pseudouridine synthase [Enterovirga rhinocerotis]TDR93517.1 23S rRNA pseudouridine1911/1915/1917 synthase [Enterovirga rhinocerotis]
MQDEVRVAVLPAGEERLDRALARAWPDLSRSRLQKLIKDGHVRLDGSVVGDSSLRPAEGAEATLVEPAPEPAAPAAQAIPLAVVYEDEEVIVIDKPAGLVVHPGAGHGSGTLVNALLAHCGASLSGIGGVARPGIVHRLDKDTSGLLVVAKTDRAHRSLAAQFADHGRTGALERAYLAFAWGVPEPRRGTVDVPLARSPSHREKIAVTSSERGRHAITHYAVEEVFGDGAGEALASLVRCRLETGRTHQIRVHLAHLRHPVVGDALYGAGFRTKVSRLGEEAASRVAELGRQALHAALLQFEHPASGEILRFESGLPPDLAALHAALRAGLE